MNIKTLSALATAGTLLLVTACGDDSDDGTAIVQSEVGASGDAPEGTDPPAGPDDGPGTTDDQPGSSVGAGGGTPQDRQLDIEMRHVGGTRVTVDSIAFDGDTIDVDLEIFNGSPGEIRLHSNYSGQGQLRLVDDDGNIYNFARGEDEGGTVRLGQGDSLSAELSFLGPLIGQPDQLRLVTNVAADDLGDWTPDDEGPTTSFPGFVVPIDLVWE